MMYLHLKVGITFYPLLEALIPYRYYFYVNRNQLVFSKTWSPHYEPNPVSKWPILIYGLVNLIFTPVLLSYFIIQNIVQVPYVSGLWVEAGHARDDYSGLEGWGQLLRGHRDLALRCWSHCRVISARKVIVITKRCRSVPAIKVLKSRLRCTA